MKKMPVLDNLLLPALRAVIQMEEETIENLLDSRPIYTAEQVANATTPHIINVCIAIKLIKTIRERFESNYTGSGILPNETTAEENAVLVIAIKMILDGEVNVN